MDNYYTNTEPNLNYNNNNIFASQSTNIQFFQNNQYELINQYINLNNEASSFISKNYYSKALFCYKEASKIAEELNDSFKKYESLYNLGIVHFYLNNINKALSSFESCYNYFKALCLQKNGHNDIKNLILLCKSGANLCMCKNEKLNENNDCLSIINNVLLIISKEDDINVKISCINCLNNCIFQVNSLLMLNNNNISLKNSFYLNKNNEEEINSINKLFVDSFVDFMAKQDFDSWINSLNKLYNKCKDKNFDNLLIKILFHKLLAEIIKFEKIEENNYFYDTNSSVKNNSKKNLMDLLKNNNLDYNVNVNNKNDITDEYINKIIENYKLKLSNIIEIYKMIQFFEKETNKSLKNNQFCFENYKDENNYYKDADLKFNLDAGTYLSLLIRKTENYFLNNIEDGDQKTELINNLKTAQNNIKEDSQINYFNLSLSSFDPDLSKYISNIYKRLFQNIKKAKERIYFNQWIFKKNELKRIEEIKKNKAKKNEFSLNFLKEQYLKICKGENILKINFRTNGSKVRYYKIENKKDELQVFENKNSKKIRHNYTFKNILKIVIGIKSKNIESKMKTMQIVKENKNRPYYFMSLYFEDGKTGNTIDLIFKNSNYFQKWFYGLYYYLIYSIPKRPYKICSCTNYILFRLKCKLFKKLNLNINQLEQKPFSHLLKKYFIKDQKATYIKKDYIKKQKEIEEK